MRPPDVHLGPLRSPYGLVDVAFDGRELRLAPADNPLDLLDRYRLVVLAWLLLFALGAAYVDRPLTYVLLGLAGVCLLLLLVWLVVEAVTVIGAVGVGAASMLTRAGRRRLREPLAAARPSRLVVVPEPDIRLMDPVHGAWRVHLVLHTVDGELRLTGWWYRRRQLVRLQRALAA